MSQSATHSIANFIWGIADDILRDNYVRGKYRDVILPMTVIRRLDALLEPTKEAVLKIKEQLDTAGIANQNAPLCQASNQAFYNTSPFTLRDLKARAKSQQLKSDFEAYLDGFSPNVQEILDKFKFRHQISHMVESDILGHIIEKFLDTAINLSSKPVMDVNGNEKLPALDNHTMGTIFEELIRRFNEENNEEAGEHFTPRDVVKLMADLVFLPIAHQIQSGTYLVYDGACGTGGMLTVAEERLQKLAKAHGKDVSTHLYGQECQPETYAICKADLLLKGEGEEAMNIKFGSTLSADAFPSQEFDFMLSNPPYGKSWKTDLERMGGKGDLKDARFVVQHGSDPEFSMITRSSDGQLMFLVNKLMKMKNHTPLGSRIAQVHNGSSLFTGDAGQGESNIRRWIIENDWLEAIIALPENMFYNTGIATYIWVLSNRKASHKKGKVQLIDASNWYVPLRKNLGKKNCEFSDDHMKMICNLLIDFRETEHSKIFRNEAFGYSKITVERPLRLKVDLSAENLSKFCRACGKEGESDLAEFISDFAKEKRTTSFSNYNEFIELVEDRANKFQLKLTKKRKDLIRNELTLIDETAEPVIKKVHKSGKLSANPLEGLYELIIDGKKSVVEYEADSNLRDTEQVPLIEQGGIEAFFKREVLPYATDAWVDTSKTQIGYEISFTKHFYKPIKMKSLEEIAAEIQLVEEESKQLFDQIVSGGSRS
jgi:type I restriction enzyme M protein